MIVQTQMTWIMGLIKQKGLELYALELVVFILHSCIHKSKQTNIELGQEVHMFVYRPYLAHVNFFFLLNLRA